MKEIIVIGILILLVIPPIISILFGGANIGENTKRKWRKMKEISKDQVLNLKTGTEYIIYNPLTKQLKVEIATPVDIVHNKHCYDKLKFYIKED